MTKSCGPRRRGYARRFYGTIPVVFQIYELCRPTSIIKFSGLNSFTLLHCSLTSPAGGFSCFVASTEAPYGSKWIRLSFPVPDFNRGHRTSFAWRTHKTFDTTVTSVKCIPRYFNAASLRNCSILWSQIKGDNLINHIVIQKIRTLRKHAKNPIFFLLQFLTQLFQCNNRTPGCVMKQNRHRLAMLARIVPVSSPTSLGKNRIPNFRRNTIFVRQSPRHL